MSLTDRRLPCGRIRPGFFGIGLLGFASTSPADAAPRGVKCQGLTPTIIGNGGTVRGTSKRDVILLRNSSRVLAGAGDDVICGSSRADDIHGGPGNDRITGGGNDRISGDAGNDVESVKPATTTFPVAWAMTDCSAALGTTKVTGIPAGSHRWRRGRRRPGR